MYVALNLALLVALILTAGLGGYVLAKAKFTALLDRRTAAYHGQITRLRRAATAAEDDAARMSGDLDRAKRQIRRYEFALHQHVEAPAPQPMPDRTAHYDTPDLREEAPSGHLDGEVLKDVKKTVDIDRFRINVVRRKIA